MVPSPHPKEDVDNEPGVDGAQPLLFRKALLL